MSLVINKQVININEESNKWPTVVKVTPLNTAPTANGRTLAVCQHGKDNDDDDVISHKRFNSINKRA